MTVVAGLLAATALQYDLMLVTRNNSDVAATEVSTVNPWLLSSARLIATTNCHDVL